MRRVVLVVTLSCSSFTLAGCPADPCELEPAYGGAATDEVYTTLHDATNDAQEGGDAAVIESPKDGAALAADEPATFSWSSALKLSSAAGSRPADPRVVRPLRPSLMDRVSDMLLPRAYAHLPPVTSDAYLVNVAIPGGECPVQAVTTELEAKLDATGWDLLKSTNAELSVRIVSAYLEDGRITEGPFISEAVSFTVK
jgi:hypothetical protein